MIREVCSALADGAVIPPGGIAAAFSDLVSGSATPAQMGAFLFALRTHTPNEYDLFGCAKILLSHAKPLDVSGSGQAVDTCGTGGDSSMTFNISTAAAFVTAGAGIPVLKHGNRAVTSRSGSADVLAAIGIVSASSQDEAGSALQNAGIAFLSARDYHPALLRLAGVRSELGFRTIFNIVGPLSHPAGPINRILGISDPALLLPMAGALRSLGVSHAMVVSGGELDELSLHGENRICELKSGMISEYMLKAEDLGLSSAPVDVLRADSPQESAEIIRRVLNGEEGPCRDIVLFNAAGAILVGGGATTFPSALTMAEQSIDSGMAADSLQHLLEIQRGSR